MNTELFRTIHKTLSNQRAAKELGMLHGQYVEEQIALNEIAIATERVKPRSAINTSTSEISENIRKLLDEGENRKIKKYFDGLVNLGNDLAGNTK